MTLVELLVGLTVASVALALGFGALTALGDNGQRADEAASLAIENVGARQILVDWVSLARLRPEGNAGFRGIDGEMDGWGDAQLTFVTTAPTPLGTHETIVHLGIDRDDETPERGLVVELVERRGTKPVRVVIAPGATGLRIRYLSGISGDDRWLPSWISSTVLPRGIDIRIESSSADSIPALLRIPIRQPLGAQR
jgi:hypothetical protein